MLQEDGISSTAEEEWRLPGPSILQVKEAYNALQSTTQDKLHAPVLLTANELMLKRLSQSAFELQQPRITYDLTLSGPPNLSEDPHHNSIENVTFLLF